MERILVNVQLHGSVSRLSDSDLTYFNAKSAAPKSLVMQLRRDNALRMQHIALCRPVDR
ncbi:MAG TPA: hypothetical protein VKC11_13015 [Steroidobacteraceae bacterium]|nr:hypothetical protein [Steroidobacteraceae bacterium]